MRLYRIIGLRDDSEWVQMHSIQTLQEAENAQKRLYAEHEGTDFTIEFHPIDKLPTQP